MAYDAQSITGTPFGTFNSWNNSQYGGWANPFSDQASLAMPETMASSLRLCEYLFGSVQGTYRQAVDRVVSYFITDIEVSSTSSRSKIDDEEKDRAENFFRENLGIYNLLHTVAIDYMCYGNAFISVMMPFRRYLYCPKCRLELILREVFENRIFQFQWSDYEFHAHCPRCKHKGAWGHRDEKGAESDIHVKRWNPHEIEILHDPLTDDCNYIWKIPSDYRRMVREGKLYHLERANWEVIQAIKHGNHLRFDENYIFHLKEDALAGIRNRGWGISRVLTNFRQIWYVQVLHRYNEAIALDYVIPFRLITPVAQGGGGDAAVRDPVLNMNMGGFMSRVNNMLRVRRRDPAAWFSLPFPIQYQTLGGDAKTLAPRELLDQGLEVLLNNVGVPTELYKGSLQIQSAPAALRLFESNWSHLVHNMNRLLAFLAKQVSDMMSWEPVKVKLMRVTHADDLNRQMAKLQLMIGKQVSQTTGLKSVGLDYKEETRKLMQEEKFLAEEQSKLQEDMDRAAQQQQMGQEQQQQQPMPGDPNAQAQQGGQPAAGGGGGTPMDAAAQGMAAEMPIGPNTPISPQELLERANTKAMQLLGMDESRRQSEMIRLKQENPTLHGLVKARMNDIRQQARTAGGAQVIKQQFGGS